MRFALILALGVAACTGKNDAKGSVEYVPDVPLSVLHGAGGHEAGVGDEGGADVDADAAGGRDTLWSEPDAGVVQVDAPGMVDAAVESMPACLPTVWTVDAGHDWSSIGQDDATSARCLGQCRRLANCSIGYVDGAQVDPCECIGEAERDRVLAECRWQCESDPSRRLLNSLESTETCGEIVATFADLDPFLGIACHGHGTAPDAAGSADAGHVSDASTLEPDAGRGEGGWADRPPALIARVRVDVEPDQRQTVITASVEQPVAAAPMGCSRQMVDPSVPVGGATGFNGGPIAMNGLQERVTLNPVADDEATYYPPAAIGQRSIAANRALMARSDGGPHLREFEVSVRAPEGVTVIEPSQPVGLGRYHQYDDFVVTWEPSNSDLITISIIPTDGLAPVAGPWTTCRVEDNGSFVIPTAYIGGIVDDPDPLGGRIAEVRVTRSSTATVTDGADVAEITAATRWSGRVAFVAW